MPVRKMSALLAVFILVLSIPFSTAFSETTPGISVTVNNQALITNVPAAYFNGTIMVPAKELMERLGGGVSYNEGTQTATLTKDENELNFRLDDSIARFNGKYMQAAAPLKILNNRLMVPAQFTAGRMGAETYINTYRNQLMIFQPVNGKIVYQIQSGDTLWIVSQVFGTSIATLKLLNGLSNDSLFVGQKLVIKSYTGFNTVYSAQTSGSATISSGAGWGYSAVGYLKAWTAVSISGKDGDWYKVSTPVGNGYIYYSVVYVPQDISDNATKSTFFNGEIPVDTSGDYITYKTYTVQKGDTLWTVAQNNGILDYELASANNLSLSVSLIIGQMLTIPVHHVPVKTTMGSTYGEVLDWFKEAQYVFPIGKVGRFTDLETGRSFMAKRTMGASHSDTETLTPQDTQTMKSIFGGVWTWNHRSFILEVDGRKIAVSIAGMPHAGVDGGPYLQNVSNRSGNYGTGPNYDSISGNGMDGHFDVYFLNCQRHVDNKIDPEHQYGVLVSGGLE